MTLIKIVTPNGVGYVDTEENDTLVCRYFLEATDESPAFRVASTTHDSPRENPSGGYICACGKVRLCMDCKKPLDRNDDLYHGFCG